MVRRARGCLVVARTTSLSVSCYQNAAAFLFIAVDIALTGATQAVFWGFTFPVNRATRGWTELPRNWRGLRDQWEYADATKAAFGVAALAALAVSVLVA